MSWSHHSMVTVLFRVIATSFRRQISLSSNFVRRYRQELRRSPQSPFLGARCNTCIRFAAGAVPRGVSFGHRSIHNARTQLIYAVTFTSSRRAESSAWLGSLARAYARLCRRSRRASAPYPLTRPRESRKARRKLNRSGTRQEGVSNMVWAGRRGEGTCRRQG